MKMDRLICPLKKKDGYKSVSICRSCKNKKTCKSFLDEKKAAIDHIKSSTKYWMSDNIHSDASFSCPSNLVFETAFDTAIRHVKACHFPYINKTDIKEIKTTFNS